MRKSTIVFSAPGKVHLLGEHAVVYGKPALLATLDLRVFVTLTPSVIVRSETTKQSSTSNGKIATFTSFARNDDTKKVQKIIESIVKKYFKIKTIPSYQLTITSQLPIGSGLGSSAAVSASYIAVLLTFLKIKWDLSLINNLTYEAEKVFHGNPSGADNSTIVFGGLIWFRKEGPDLKLIQPLPFSIPPKLAKNFILINTGRPKETTKDMVVMVKNLYQKKPKVVDRFLENQEQLTKELLEAVKLKNEKKLISIIKMGENNLENIAVVSKSTAAIIREIEVSCGAAKICGGGGKKGPTGILLCYHPTPKIVENIAKSHNLDYFKTALGVEGLRKEK